MPPALSNAVVCGITPVCCTHSAGTRLPLRSAMVLMFESFLTQKAIWKPYSVIAVRKFGLALPFQLPPPLWASATSPTSSSGKSEGQRKAELAHGDDAVRLPD